MVQQISMDGQILTRPKAPESPRTKPHALAHCGLTKEESSGHRLAQPAPDTLEIRLRSLQTWKQIHSPNHTLIQIPLHLSQKDMASEMPADSQCTRYQIPKCGHSACKHGSCQQACRPLLTETHCNMDIPHHQGLWKN